MRLPYRCILTELIIQDRDLKNFHAGLGAMMAILQQEFLILSARRAVCSILFRYMLYYRLKANLVQPLMGDLRSDRVWPSRPFGWN